MSDSDDELLDDDSSEEENDKKRKLKGDKGDNKKPRLSTMIDDAAQESGEEGGDDDDEEEEDENAPNDYVRDGFVVDEAEEEVGRRRRRKKRKGELEDSDEDDDDDDEGGSGYLPGKKKGLRKMRELDRLDEDDLALINEAQGDRRENFPQKSEDRKKIVAHNEAELRRGLFYDSGGEEDDGGAIPAAQKRRVARYDEHGMDDFIEDDIGDQRHIQDSDIRNFDEEGAPEVSEAQLNEASEIFGSEYLDFMASEEVVDDNDEADLFGTSKYKERGVGVDLGVDSEEDISDDDDDDLFEGDDDENDGRTAAQKAEALRLKREKRELKKAERRRNALKKKTDRRKAQLKKAFEPVQLVEHFCTDRDDEIRKADIPERYFDRSNPFHGSEDDGMTDGEKEEAMWIMGRVQPISSEFASASYKMDADTESRQRSILESIVNALRFIHRDNLEPAFIKYYRADSVTSPAVRNNLYAVMDEDVQWGQMTAAHDKVGNLINSLTAASDADEAGGREEEEILKLKEKLKVSQVNLDETAEQESTLKEKIEVLSKTKSKGDDDDDELFADDDDDEDDDQAKLLKKKEKEEHEKHLSTIQTLLQERAERVSMLQSQLQTMEAQNSSTTDSLKPSQQVVKKVCRKSLWNKSDYTQHLSALSEERHILDLNGYLNLIKEGNKAIRKKEMPSIADGDKSNAQKRSRRFDRDYYRTCVADGLRAICYKFLLAPNRVGIKLEDNFINNGFDFEKKMPAENKDGDGDGDNGGPLQWVAPIIPNSDPLGFASDLVGSGELVLLANSQDIGDHEAKDPLRGCRYVAALELAHEPRIRKHLRNIYRRCAVFTTKPTKQGMNVIDAFHEYYGLHLIRNKPVKDHFAMDEREFERRKANLTPIECNELDTEMQKRVKKSCIQYVNILKAEQTGFISIHVHLPLRERSEDWYKPGKEIAARDDQDLTPLMNELEKIYLPPDGDTVEWNEERRKVLRTALISFILPQFEAEARKDLREAAINIAVAEAGQNLSNMATEGPYRPTALVHTENRFLYPTGDLPLVGVFCPSEGKEATYLASVDRRGQLNDHIAIPDGTRIDSHKMKEKVITFLLQYRPAAVLVGTSGGFDSRFLTRKLNDLISEATNRWHTRDVQGDDEDDEAFEDRRRTFEQIYHKNTDLDDDDDLEWKCNADMVDDSIAQLFGRSIRGTKEFPEATINLKCAVSIARYGKDPLSEITYAWTVASDAGVFGTELLYVDIHPMQQLLSKTLLLRQYERSLCDAVAEIGVDINNSCALDHLHGNLTFVPGLGPRKAANLRQRLAQIESGGMVGGRRMLLEKYFMGPCVYNNAVAFFRIREIDHQFLHPLDDTRLHPDVYHRNNWAVKIAIDALEREDAKNKESASNQALRDVMDNSRKEVERLFRETKVEWESRYGPTFGIAGWNPRTDVPHDAWRDKVEELDLEAFANMIEQNQQGRWHSHLQMIKWEFRLPFADPRKPMEPLTGDKLFRLITRETDQSLRPGKEVIGKVIKNGDFGSHVKIEGNIQAFIPLRNLSDERVESAEDIVQVGQVVTAVVTAVKKDHMSVDLSLKMEDLRRGPSTWDRPSSLAFLDDYFDRVSAAIIEEEANEKRIKHLVITSGEDGSVLQPRNRVQRRACAHPAFRNLRQDEVDRELREAGEMMVGEALVRPSRKNCDSLAVHWVVKSGCIKVIEVLEEDKDTDASVGNTLKIKEEVYGSIDEMMGRYIAPMNDYVEELVNHRKFVDLPEDEVDDKLKELKKAVPKSIPYHICWMEMHPGCASLRFIVSATPRNHVISISPNGYLWGSKLHSNLDKLINTFKKNPRGISSSRRDVSDNNRSESAPRESAPQRPSRWGAKSAAPPPPSDGGWSQPMPPLPPAPAVAQGNWGSVSATQSGWHDSRSQQPPPPNLPPPPRGFQPPPPMGRPPQAPPPSFGQPPPPGPPPGPPPQYPQAGNPPNFQFRPPPPAGGPPSGYPPPPRVQH